MPLLMNRNLFLVPVVVACMVAASHAFGQSSGEQAARLIETPARTGLNQLRVSARLGYNISAHLENVGVPAGQTFLPAPPKDPNRHFESATPFTYVDGYVGIDENGNPTLPGDRFGSQTFYWGYARQDQIAGDTLLLTHSSSGTLLEDFKN